LIVITRRGERERIEYMATDAERRIALSRDHSETTVERMWGESLRVRVTDFSGMIRRYQGAGERGTDERSTSGDHRGELQDAGGEF
jgi:hypothetical protein